MADIHTDVDSIGGYGGYGGFGGFGGIAPFGLIGFDRLFNGYGHGNKNECCNNATKDDVQDVDRDLLDKTCEIKETVNDGNYKLNDSMKEGFYAVNNTIKDGFYGIMSEVKDLKTQNASNTEKILCKVTETSLQERIQCLEDKLADERAGKKCH